MAQGFHSTGNGNGVEVAVTSALIGVRDSKDLAGPVLAISPAEWSALLTGIQHGRFGPS